MSKPMKISAAEFKTKCLKLMDLVAQNKIHIIVTKRGKAVAKLVPASNPETLFGRLAGTVTYHDDIINPISVDWNIDEDNF